MGEGSGVSVAEATLIAQEAAGKALKTHTDNLPALMKPVMYEVAETVARRNSADNHKMLTTIFGADVTNQDHLRDVHKDLYYLRDLRISHEQRVSMRRQEFWRATWRYAILALVTGAGAILALVGVNMSNLPKVP